jgi:hypothetical protein
MGACSHLDKEAVKGLSEARGSGTFTERLRPELSILYI